MYPMVGGETCNSGLAGVVDGGCDGGGLDKGGVWC